MDSNTGSTGKRSDFDYPQLRKPSIRSHTRYAALTVPLSADKVCDSSMLVDVPLLIDGIKPATRVSIPTQNGNSSGTSTSSTALRGTSASLCRGSPST